MPVCTDCGGTVIEYDQAAGNGFCVQCGTVVEENTIVNEVGFGETASGAAIVQGSFVGQGATHARMSGPYGNRGSNESREQTIANASKKIQNIANVLKLSEVVCLAATRLYTLAVEHKFTKGRKSMNVVAVCLYVACRQKETRNYMLIDFSDLLQVNVFELGHTYLQLVQTLNLRLPLVDPSHYISRFSALLEFGDETHRVATDAVRLVQRFDRDWMTRGRRPAGICGAALLLAARMNNFRRSVEEIVQVVKIADTTLKKRLDEFKATPSGALTLADFRNVWLDEEMDPPAYTKGKEREEALRRAAEGGGDEDAQGNRKAKKGSKKRKGKRKRGEETDDEEEQQLEASSQLPPRQPLDLSILSDSILADVIPAPESTLVDNSNIDPALLDHSLSIPATLVSQNSSIPTPNLSPPAMTLVDETASEVLTEEVSTFLHNTVGERLTEALDEAESRRLASIAVVDELMGLNEEELDKFILSEDEVKIKERVWVELNKDYLEALAGEFSMMFNTMPNFSKGDQEASGTSRSRKRRKTNNKPRDASSAAGDTAAESVRNLIKKNPKYSKRINYEALKDLFVNNGSAPSIAKTMTTSDDEKDDAELYTMPDDDYDKTDEGEMNVIVEEEPGTVVLKPATAGKKKKGVEALLEEVDEEASDDDKEDDMEYEDAYEQEV
ncbi:Transcription factor IIIB 60 kDa subunit [Psilocybe cubensis]|uniref:B-related factor 1 n=2 Tax=Psilocybe cubensis TaxID=181762 RepID=A0A8H7XNS7_PSICU|nr:Transcription factor IIIB 60 kDa subunit [Psilocybe cubensis]KAH9475098.1 Transcription factor IIIB 60 kDa subunit [Psilocybe cubensis]